MEGSQSKNDEDHIVGKGMNPLSAQIYSDAWKHENTRWKISKQFRKNGKFAISNAKVMDVKSRLQGCAGRAAIAVSDFTQVKTEDTPTLLKIPESECPDIWICLPRHKWPKSWSSMEDSVVPLERNLYGHPLAGLLWERQFETILWKYGWEKGFQLELLIRTPWKKLFLSVYVDDIKLAGKKRNINPMWKVLNNEVDLGEPTSFLDHANLWCTQRQCEISKDIVDNYRTMFESRISAEWVEKLPFTQNLRISSWSYDWMLVKNQNKWFMRLETLNCVNCWRRNPERSAKYVYHMGTIVFYCTCRHFLRTGREEKQKFIKYTMDFLSIPEYVVNKGRPHRHRYGKKPGDNEYYIANQLKKKCKKFFQGIHDRFIRDPEFRNRIIEKWWKLGSLVEYHPIGSLVLRRISQESIN